MISNKNRTVMVVLVTNQTNQINKMIAWLTILLPVILLLINIKVVKIQIK